MSDAQNYNLINEALEKNEEAQEHKFDAEISGTYVKPYNEDENNLIQEDDYINSNANKQYNYEQGVHYQYQENYIEDKKAIQNYLNLQPSRIKLPVKPIKNGH